MVPEGVLDTSVVVGHALADTRELPGIGYITTVTLAELSVGPDAARDPAERRQRLSRLRDVEANFEALAFDAVAARTFASVATALRADGRKAAARSFDAMIAAIAISHGLPLFTANPRDFRGIPGLVVRSVTLAKPG